MTKNDTVLVDKNRKGVTDMQRAYKITAIFVLSVFLLVSCKKNGLVTESSSGAAVDSSMNNENVNLGATVGFSGESHDYDKSAERKNAFVSPAGRMYQSTENEPQYIQYEMAWFRLLELISHNWADKASTNVDPKLFSPFFTLPKKDRITAGEVASAALALSLVEEKDPFKYFAAEGLFSETVIKTAADELTNEDALKIWYNLIYMRDAEKVLFGVKVNLLKDQPYFKNDIRFFKTKNDGSADCSAQIMKAAKSGIVFLPPGKYKVDKSINFPDNSGIIGTFGSVMLSATGSAIWLKESDNVVFRNFILTSERPETSGTFLRGDRTSNLMIDKVTFKEKASMNGGIVEIHGKPVWKQTEDSAGCDNIFFTNNYVKNYQGAESPVKLGGPGVTFVWVRGAVIANNTIVQKKKIWSETEYTDFQPSGVEFMSSIYGLISNNRVDTTGQGLDLGGGGGAKSDTGEEPTFETGLRGTAQTFVNNNHISNTYIMSIKTVHGAGYNVIYKNLLEKSGLFGIGLGDGYEKQKTYSRNIIAAGNTIKDMNTGIGKNFFKIDVVDGEVSKSNGWPTSGISLNYSVDEFAPTGMIVTNNDFSGMGIPYPQNNYSFLFNVYDFVHRRGSGVYDNRFKNYSGNNKNAVGINDIFESVGNAVNGNSVSFTNRNGELSSMLYEPESVTAAQNKAAAFLPENSKIYISSIQEEKVVSTGKKYAIHKLNFETEKDINELSDFVNDKWRENGYKIIDFFKTETAILTGASSGGANSHISAYRTPDNRTVMQVVIKVLV